MPTASKYIQASSITHPWADKKAEYEGDLFSWH